MPPTLLNLPAEIRDLIWEYSLVSPTGRILAVSYDTEPIFHAPSPSRSAIPPPIQPPQPTPWTAKHPTAFLPTRKKPSPLPSRPPSTTKPNPNPKTKPTPTKNLYLVACAP